jgi:tRNA pseudouridine32 synthase / 23S rRNA pseudouridine746 synthase
MAMADNNRKWVRNDLRQRVLFQDDRIIVIDKPAGLPVHAGPRGGLNLETLLPQLAVHPKHLPMLAHRLDTDTCGCLILARKRSALRKLHDLFAAGQIGKTYWAIVEGQPSQPSGTIDGALKKVSDVSGWRMVVGAGGHHAVTDYKTLGQTSALTWLELKPRTGRTHQIRVHCASLGCPVLGDPVYGATAKETKVLLHLIARRISIPFDEGALPIEAEAPLPDHLGANFAACGYKSS